MIFSIQLKSLLSSIYLNSGIFSRKLKRIATNHFLILTYHRILPRELVTENVEDGMYVTPQAFEMQIRFLRQYFNILPASSILEDKFIDNINNSDKPICFLTFDDGWYDFYEYAYPILVKYNTPALIFITTGYIDTNNWFWTDRLASILNKKHHSKMGVDAESNDDVVSGLVSQIENIKGNSKKRIDLAIKILKKHNHRTIESVLSELSKRYLGIQDLEGRSFLSWKEIRDIHKSGLVEFGSHTNMHKLLDKIPEQEMIAELEESKTVLLEHSIVDQEALFFCYPNGNYNQNIIEKVEQAGYKLAFTTKHSWQNFDYEPYELRRVAIHNDITFSKALFAGRIAGII